MNATVNNDRFIVEPSVNNHFAWMRTRLALERTFMAWMRTSVSLIGFGFTIVQFFQRVEDSGGPMKHPEAPRVFGLALIAAGVLSLGVSALQYRLGLRYLWSATFQPIAGAAGKPLWTPVLLAACVIMAIGIFAFGSVFIRF